MTYLDICVALTFVWRYGVTFFTHSWIHTVKLGKWIGAPKVVPPPLGPPKSRFLPKDEGFLQLRKLYFVPLCGVSKYTL